MDVKEGKSFKKLKADMKNMTFTEKCGHLWSYYRWIIIVVVMAILTVSGGCAIYKNANTNHVVTGLCLNLDASDKAQTYLTETFRDQFGQGLKYEEAAFYEMVLDEATMKEDIEGYQYTKIAIHAMFTAAEVDYLITNMSGMQNVYDAESMDQAFFDLNKVLPAEDIAEIKAMQTEDDVKMVTINGVLVGIDISHLPIAKEFAGAGEKPVFFCVISNTERVEMVKEVWNYLNNWEAGV